MATPVISQAADDLIVASEVGSKAQYEKLYQRPEWPGGASGVTIGIGYDLGYATVNKVQSDWATLLPQTMIEVMVNCVGLTGADAQAKLPIVKSSILVPWNNAIAVYEHVDIPDWTDKVCKSIPGAEKLPADCLGALTSLAYNRGASFNNAGDRYKEMRAIRSHIVAGELDQVSPEIRAMKRLWGSDQRGLLIRRDKEAALWDKGLATPSTAQPQVPSKPNENPPPLSPPKPVGASEGAGAVTGAVITGKLASEATNANMDPLYWGLLVGAGVVLTIGTVAYIRYRNSLPVLARQKG